MNAEQMAEALAGVLSEQGIPEGQGTTELPAEVPEEVAVPAELAGHDEEPELEAEPGPVAEEAEAETPPEPVQEEAVELPQDINSLAEAIGTEASYLYGVKVKLADSGEQIPIGQLKDRLQESQRELKKLKEQPVPEQTGPSLSDAQQDYKAVQNAAQQLEKGWIEYQQSEEWLKLQQEDPQQALRTMSMYEIRKREIAQAHEKALGAVRAEQQKLLAGMSTYIPSWSDSTVMATERQSLKTALKDAGVSPIRIENETDPALVAVLHEWMKMKEAPKPKPSPSGLKPLVPISKPTSGAKPNPKAQMQKAQRIYGKAKTPEQKAAAFTKILGL